MYRASSQMDARRRQLLPFSTLFNSSRHSDRVQHSNTATFPQLFSATSPSRTSNHTGASNVVETMMCESSNTHSYPRAFSKSPQSFASVPSRPITRSTVLVLASFLILFVTLNVHLLRADRCAQGLTSQTSHHPAPDETSVRSSDIAPAEVSDENLVTTTRRKRPMPSCALNPGRAKAFLMVFVGHSGSTAILTDLRNHSQIIGGDTEPVDHQPVFNTTEALATARRIFEHGIKVGQISGFKIRPAHIVAEPDAWRSLVAEYGVRIIWQYRKNLFKAAVGEYTNRHLNDTSVVEGLHANLTREERCKIGVGCSFKIDNFDGLHTILTNMIRSQRMITLAVAELSRDSRCVREVPYEDYLYDRQAVMNDLFQFLGVTNENTTPARFKATSDRMCEIVLNWDQVCDKFYGCVLWQPMLDDARNRCFCNMTSGAPSGQYCEL